jgi:hypothetical protein
MPTSSEDVKAAFDAVAKILQQYGCTLVAVPAFNFERGAWVLTTRVEIRPVEKQD